MMRVFRGLDDLSDVPHSASLVLGNFDGVHRGHAALVGNAQASTPVGIVTFTPHPRLLTQPGQPPFLLTPGEEKYIALGALGVRFCVELAFTREFASLSAEEFVCEILVGRLHVGRVICGHGFRFGAARKGDVALLRQLGARYGFSVEGVGPILDANGDAYSSSRVRNCLAAGDVAGGAAILGRPWTIKARLQRDVLARASRGYFHFGPYLKPLPARYNAHVRLEGRGVVEAELVVSEVEHAGWLEFPKQVALRPAENMELELIGLVAPLVLPEWGAEAELGNACYI
jgi:riboflavin kinase / FMN adenylyltransferase